MRNDNCSIMKGSGYKGNEAFQAADERIHEDMILEDEMPDCRGYNLALICNSRLTR